MRITDPATGQIRVEKRLHRYPEHAQPRALTFSCYQHLPLLSRERTCVWFRDALKAACTEFGFQLWAYVVMPEHVHLLVQPGDAPEQMPRFLRGIKEPVARQAIHYLEQRAPGWLARLRITRGEQTRHYFWQPGGGYDHNVQSIAALRATIDYLHANPVRRGLVARAEDWEWSSAQWFAGIRPVRLAMDEQVLAVLAAG